MQGIYIILQSTDIFNKMKKNNIFLILPFILLVSCKENKESKQQEELLSYGDTVIVSADSPLNNRLKVITATAENWHAHIVTAGLVKAIPSQYAAIAPHFSGRVTKSYAYLGMQVLPDTPLFEINSSDFIEAQKVFFQAKSQYFLAKKQAQREQGLMEHGIGSERNLEEANTELEIQEKEYENARMSIRLFKADPEKLVMGQAFVVRSPIKGEVVDNNIGVGQFIKEDGDPVAAVAEFSKVWVVGQVKEKDIRFINEKDECTISVAAFPDKLIKAKVFHVGEAVEESTRSVETLMLCDNADYSLKPGMYATVNFQGASTKALVVPTKAIVQMNEHQFVFVQVSPNKYVRRKVEIMAIEKEKAIIKSGILLGEKVLSEGGIYLLEAY